MQELASANPELLDRCADDDCQALGRLLGADEVVQETLTRAGGPLSLSLRLVDTRSGRTLAAQAATAADADALLSAIPRAARALLQEMRSHAKSGGASPGPSAR